MINTDFRPNHKFQNKSSTSFVDVDEALVVYLRLGIAVVGQSIDEEIASADKSGNFEKLRNRIYIFDLSDARFISIACSHYIIAFVRKCAKLRWDFRLILPTRRKVRDFWKLWRFYEALEVAADKPWVELLYEEDRILAQERQQTFFERSAPTTYQTGSDTLRSENFFGFHSMHLNSHSKGMIAVAEADQWRTKEIRDIVERGLGIRSDYFSSRVVFEAVFNAVKHPAASLIQTSSWHPRLYQRRNPESDEEYGGAFSLTVWDNGKPFSAVMNRALEDGVTLRGEVKPYNRSAYLVSYRDLSTAPEKPSPLERDLTEVVESDIEINADTPEHLRLLSTVFAGVSTSSLTNEDERLEESNRRGMGLFVLSTTVCMNMNGKVSLRSGRHFMQLSKAKARYAHQAPHVFSAKIFKLPMNVPTFYGNMLSVDLKVPKL